MANTIILKRSATPGKVPTTSQLALGEIAINTYDGLLYIKKDDGTASVVQIGGVTSVNGETGSVTIDTGDVAENGNLYFTNARARSAVSAGTGISYNSSTGVISTTQNLSSAGSPSFAGLTLTGNATVTGDILPSADNVYSLGSANLMWKDVFVGPGSLYINGQKVLEDNSGTITFSADPGQSLQIKTTGAGNVQLSTDNSGVIQVTSTLQIASGKNITDSAGVEVNFGDNIDMNNNKIVGLGTPSANTDAATKGYVDTAVSAISTSSIAQGNSNISISDTGNGTVTVTVDGSTALTVDANGVTVAGNFTVSGTQTVVNSNTINLADNIITLNSDHTGAPSQNAGILVERGDEADTQLRWNEGSDKWTFTNDGAVYYPMATSTDDLAEGSTNQYHTTARARGAISASSATGVSYNSTTGAISLGSIPNSSLSNSSITINGTAVALGGTRTLDTDAVSEGSTNQYFTTARARSSVSAGTGISYNSTTGAISTSAIPNASLSNSKVTVGSTDISLGASATTIAGLTSVTSTSFVGALTGNADTATSAGKWTTARTITLGGDLTGSVSVDGSANVTLTATVAANSVALGTDTTGNYMVDLTAGTGITVTHTPGEGSNATVAVDTSTIATKAYVDSSVQAKDNTDEITEGTTNLFFTNARARGAVSAGTGISYNSTTGVITNTITQYTDALARSAVSVTDSGGDGSLSYNSTTGVITYTGPSASEVRAHFSAGTGITITNGAIATTITQYTDALARGAVSFTAGSGAYNSTTGVITIPTNTNQLTNGAGFLSTAVTSAAAGTGISVSASTGAVTFTNTDTGSAQNIFKNVAVSGQTTVVADSNNDTLTFAAGTGVGITTDATTDTVTFTNTGVTSAVAGTGVGVSGATGAVTFSIGQAVATSSNVQFNSLGVGTAGSGTAGQIRATNEITAYYSDKRLKENIKPIENALAKTLALHGVTYNANDVAASFGYTNKETQVGLLAQDVKAVLPEVVVPAPFDIAVRDGKEVSKSGEDYMTVKYEKIVALLVEAVKELNDKVESLEAKLGGSKSL